MSLLILLCITSALGFICLERLKPARKLPIVKSWWLRLAIVNLIQASIVILGGNTWDPFFLAKSDQTWLTSQSLATSGLVGYVFITFFFYWWHRMRHSFQLLWRHLHAFHHSPARIETLTSFYKVPWEILFNSILIGVICYPLLGLSAEQASLALLYSAIGEYFYHSNIKTSHWLGYFFQRPEMHRVHHQTHVHNFNFSDLPLWDLMFGTFSNPREEVHQCGFTQQNELHLFREVYKVNLTPES